MASYPVIGQAKKLKVTVLEIPAKSGKTAKTLGKSTFSTCIFIPPMLQ